MNIKKILNLTVILRKLSLDRLNPLILIGIGAVLLTFLVVLLLTGDDGKDTSSEELSKAQLSLTTVKDLIQGYRRVLLDSQVQEMAANAASDPKSLVNLEQYVSGRVQDFAELRLFDTRFYELKGEDLGPFGFALLDMIFAASETGTADAQIHGVGESAYLALAVRVGDEASPVGFLLLKLKTAGLVAAFNNSTSSSGAGVMDQYNGRFSPTVISGSPVSPSQSSQITWLHVPGTLFRVGVSQSKKVKASDGILHFILLLLGVLLTGTGIYLKIRPPGPVMELAEDPVASPGDEDETNREHQELEVSTVESPVVEEGPVSEETEAVSELEPPQNRNLADLGNLSVDLEQRSMARKADLDAVELQSSIFKAYDIRGVIGKSLDAGIARQVGQVLGSQALEQDAAPVIVARDGRSSGPALVEGMVEGIASTGCDVINIGAVPTGVLYYAAYELGSGTGVMITGSHNPPEYNGFKMLIGGVTQAGDQIKAVYDRIQSGNVLEGKGTVSTEEMIERYRDRIAGDIQLERPLKVVADCGNGIGGVCAADVLRATGAEVIALFDEVDGTFPNHHPDPSEPENLMDLIQMVMLMDADLGVAFDGDADRLGVVTKSGEIIYSDRLMMLFIEDILKRVPNETIIYDVKCTGHLHHMIEEAGGKPMMYKTGHSLIKNKMREVDSPFAGEMSGHFFFKERWYGFDCGIYSAARLLEILAADSREPEVVLNKLPNSVSTPELKVPMDEGLNHAFVLQLQEKCNFEDARINNIDGVRADWDDGWGLVRASNTTPVLVLRFDADTEEALKRIQAVFKEQMHAINQRLPLPF
jgi:phosphomannomutase/phosphoglucomutase